MIVLLILIVLFMGYYKFKTNRDVIIRRSTETNARMAILNRLYDMILDSADEEDVKMFLIYGTLLGQHRNNKLICYDYDLDFGMNISDFNKIAPILKKKIKNYDDFTFNYKSFLDYKSIEIIHTDTRISADIFVFYNVGTKVKRSVPSIYTVGMLGECKDEIDSSVLYPLKETIFLSRPIYVPNKPEELLKCYYGDNFMTPDHSCNSDCSICKKI